MVYDTAEAKESGICDAGSCAVITKALHSMYQADIVAHKRHEVQLENYWNTSDQELPLIYRQMASLQWPVLARQSVKAGANKEALGACIGLSRGNRQAPYIHMPPAHIELMHTVIRSVRMAFPQFTFTSAQFNIGLCAGLHTDSANVGPSMIVALGGDLWMHQPREGKG